jgi:NADH-quinone oxidoreductase subunit J
MLETITFYVLSGLAIGTAAMVIGQRNPIYSVLLLIALFVAQAGLYVLLDAPFLAVVQIIVYAGAIMVLFLFVVMLLNAPHEDAAPWDQLNPLRQPRIAAWGAALGALIVVQLTWALLRVGEVRAGVASRVEDGEPIASVAAIGEMMFTRHTFAFEATAVLIMVAMIGAVVLASRWQAGDQGR